MKESHMERSSRWISVAGAVAALVGTAQVAAAHAGHIDASDALTGGVLHPLLGPDHLLAALASGLLAVRVGSRRALWVIPVAFVGLMLAGGAFAAMGMPLPQAEWVIGFSVIAISLFAAVLPTVPLHVAAGLVGLFAVAHGHAHVMDLSGQALAPTLVGIALATLSLHALAIGVGLFLTREKEPQLVRVAGGATAALFLVILVTA
jgi:urease accessory protein